jgi:ParB-like chromosome segregation protein Spo0J
MTKQLEDHPIAELFDLATDAEIVGLAQNINEHGQIEPIDVYEGKILDGRNRYRACLSVGVEPRCQQWTPNGASAMDYVLSKNLHRRHLTIAQRAALGVRLLDYEREEALKRKAEAGRSAAPGRPSKKDSPNTDSLSKGRAAEKAAAKVGVGRTSVLAAELIARESPKTFEKMRRGQISVTAAATEAGIGTGTYTKKKPHQKFTSEEVQATATAADNVHAAHFYTGMAANVQTRFNLIPTDQLSDLIAEAEEAKRWWAEIVDALKKETTR